MLAAGVLTSRPAASVAAGRASGTRCRHTALESYYFGEAQQRPRTDVFQVKSTKQRVLLGWFPRLQTICLLPVPAAETEPCYRLTQLLTHSEVYELPEAP